MQICQCETEDVICKAASHHQKVSSKHHHTLYKPTLTSPTKKYNLYWTVFLILLICKPHNVRQCTANTCSTATNSSLSSVRDKHQMHSLRRRFVAWPSFSFPPTAAYSQSKTYDQQQLYSNCNWRTVFLNGRCVVIAVNKISGATFVYDARYPPCSPTKSVK